MKTLQSDCVELKSVGGATPCTVDLASIGLCGIEIVQSLHGPHHLGVASIGLCGIEIIFR